MSKPPSNSFFVEFYSKTDGVLFNSNIEYFNEYVEAINTADSFKFNEKIYKKKHVEMEHILGGSFKVQLNVIVE